MVAPAIIAAGISAGSRLLGGLLGKSSSDKATSRTAESAAADRALQKEFAKNGIRWKVADAEAAGLHPLAAIGAQGASYSPVSAQFTADTSMPSALSGMGQDISRAITASSSKKDRVTASILKDQLIRKGSLENDLLQAQITRLKSAQVGPGVPSEARVETVAPGQSAIGAWGEFDIKPGETSAQSLEDIYGDIAGDVEGLPRYIRDRTKNFRKGQARQRSKNQKWGRKNIAEPVERWFTRQRKPPKYFRNQRR